MDSNPWRSKSRPAAAFAGAWGRSNPNSFLNNFTSMGSVRTLRRHVPRQRQGDVVPTEAQGIVKGRAQIDRPRFVGNVVEIAVGIGVLVVDRRGKNLPLQGEDADDR